MIRLKATTKQSRLFIVRNEIIIMNAVDKKKEIISYKLNVKSYWEVEKHVFNIEIQKY